MKTENQLKRVVVSNDPGSWFDALWEAVWAAEDSGNFSEDDIDDMKTAMAWLMEERGIDIVEDIDRDPRDLEKGV